MRSLVHGRRVDGGGGMESGADCVCARVIRVRCVPCAARARVCVCMCVSEKHLTAFTDLHNNDVPIPFLSKTKETMKKNIFKAFKNKIKLIKICKMVIPAIHVNTHASSALVVHCQYTPDWNRCGI